MASVKPIEVVVAILVLIIVAFLVLWALYYNVKGSSIDIRKSVENSFEKISKALGIPYTPSKVDTHIRFPTSEEGEKEEVDETSTKPLGKDSCKDPKGSGCIIPPNDPKKDNKDDLPYYNKECILKDEYMWICRYLSR